MLISKTSYVGISKEFFVYVDMCVSSALIDFRRILTTGFGRDFSVEIVDGQNHCNRFKIEGTLRYDLNGLLILKANHTKQNLVKMHNFVFLVSLTVTKRADNQEL